MIVVNKKYRLTIYLFISLLIFGSLWYYYYCLQKIRADIIKPQAAVFSTEGCNHGRPNNICEVGETLSNCSQDCAGINQSIKNGLFLIRRATDGEMNFINQNLQAISKQFKIMITTQYDGKTDDETAKIYGQAKQIKEANPANLVLAFRYVGKMLATDYDVRHGILNPAVGSNTESCFLKNPRTGDLIQENSNTYLMDITSQCWKDYLVNFAKDKKNKYNLDGVFIDQANPSFKFQLDAYKNGTLTDNDLPANYAANWDKNVSALIDYLKKNSGGLTVFWNGPKCDVFSEFDCNQGRIPYGDGFMFERFAFAGNFTANPVGYLNLANWKKHLEIALKGQNQGKKVFISNYVRTDFEINSPQVKNLQRYLLSSYLMAAGDNSYYGIAIDKTAPYGGMAFFDDWNIDVGNPLGAYSEQNGIYKREFSKALVVVNPNDSAKSLFLNKTYYTPEGQAVSGRYTLNSHEGQILLNANPANQPGQPGLPPGSVGVEVGGSDNSSAAGDRLNLPENQIYALKLGEAPASTFDLSIKPPTKLIAKDFPNDSGDKIELSWQKSLSPDIEGYKIFRREEGQKFGKIAEASKDSERYIDSKVEKSKKYYYIIRAYKGKSESKSSNEYWAIPIDNLTLEADKIISPALLKNLKWAMTGSGTISLVLIFFLILSWFKGLKAKTAW